MYSSRGKKCATGTGVSKKIDVAFVGGTQLSNHVLRPDLARFGRKRRARIEPAYRPMQPPRPALLGLVLLAALLSIGAGRARAAAYVPHEVIVGYRAGAVETPALAGLGVRSSTPAPTPGSRVLHLRPGESVAAAIAVFGVLGLLPPPADAMCNCAQ